jgi:hypothetical protein
MVIVPDPSGLIREAHAPGTNQPGRKAMPCPEGSRPVLIVGPGRSHWTLALAPLGALALVTRIGRSHLMLAQDAGSRDPPAFYPFLAVKCKPLIA